MTRPRWLTLRTIVNWGCLNRLLSINISYMSQYCEIKYLTVTYSLYRQAVRSLPEEDGALTERDEVAREAVPGEHPSALGAAVLRIGASLDLDTVFTEVVDGARA